MTTMALGQISHSGLAPSSTISGLAPKSLPAGSRVQLFPALRRDPLFRLTPSSTIPAYAEYPFRLRPCILSGLAPSILAGFTPSSLFRLHTQNSLICCRWLSVNTRDASLSSGVTQIAPLVDGCFHVPGVSVEVWLAPAPNDAAQRLVVSTAFTAHIHCTYSSFPFAIHFLIRDPFFPSREPYYGSLFAPSYASTDL